MIEINLLPGARKAKRTRKTAVDFGAIFADIAARVRDPYMIGAVASVLVGVLAVGGLWFFQGRREGALTERQQKAVQDSTLYAAVIAQRVAAEAQRDSVVRQIAIIKVIDGTRYVWPHILDEVSRALTPYTWIQSLAQTSAVPSLPPEVETGVGGPGAKSTLAAQADSAANAAGTVAFRIVGNTVDLQAMTRFIRALEESPWIEGVTLQRTDAVLIQPQAKEATQFTLDMRLQRPDSAVIRRVPLSVQVR